MGDVAPGIPERLGRLPGDQVAGGQLSDDTPTAFRSAPVAGGHQHPPDAGRGVGEDERVTPVGRLVALRRTERVLRVLVPGDHAVSARRVRDELQRETVLAEARRILSGVEQVMDALLVLDDAAGVGVEVGLGLGAMEQCDPTVLEGDQVSRRDQRPRRAGLRRLTVLEQVVEQELAVPTERDDVAHPPWAGWKNTESGTEAPCSND